MQRYIITCPVDELWGIFVTSVGSQNLAPGEHYPPQNHPTRYLFEHSTGRTLDEFQLIYLAAGSGTFESNSTGTLKVTAGDAFILFPGEWHTYAPDPETGWKEYWIGFKGTLPCQWMQRGLISPNAPLLHADFSDEIIGDYNKAIDIASQQKSAYQQALSGLAVKLVTEVLYHARNKVFTEARSDGQMLRAKNFISSQEGNTSPEEVASVIGMGYSRFRKLFKDYSGFSPAKYILEIRMAKAKELLVNTDMQIQEIAWKLGFSNADYFSTTFKRICTITPNEHRAKFQFTESE